ncbi:MAG: beta-ketoacyl synthase N-terminal-like domain-containing protein, partial [Verrucomicrobiota bacterium]
MQALPTREGLEAFETLVSQGCVQAMVAYGKPSKMDEKLLGWQKKKSREKAPGDLIERRERFPTPISNPEPIAVIGLSGRYPGADDLTAFWNNLRSGKDSITEIPEERWELEHFYDAEIGKAGKSYSKWGGFVADVDQFDPLFFNISPRVAENMDPQTRLFLEESWKALEDSGYVPHGLSKKERVGVFAGVFWTDYQLYRATLNQTQTSSFVSSVANTVSYHLDFSGPSIGLDTQCSSSLTAIHLACESIQKGESSMALAGGVNLSLHPSKYTWLSSSLFLSSKGKCESFGAGGDGYVPSEGVGVAVLKPLSKAQRAGDHIYGVIKGTAINHGGKSSGFTVPNPKAQAEVIVEAMKRAGVQAEEISYLEAHGTGTSLGDPIEIAGLSKAFERGNHDQAGQWCSIGSLKSNIGHAESAAGIGGVTKVLLQLKHGQLVPSLHSGTLNPNIDFGKTPFRVQQVLADWETEGGRPRMAGVSSFGAGGSNAHVIIEEYQEERGMQHEALKQEGPFIIPLSAKNEERLEELVRKLLDYLNGQSAIVNPQLSDLAYTLQMGREAMESRLALVVNELEELKMRLAGYQKGERKDLLIGDVKKDQSDFLLEGAAGKGYIEIAVKNKESKSLAQLWVKGVEIDWDLLYEEGQKPNKVSLPTYPFARKHYWFKTAMNSSNQYPSPEIENTLSQDHSKQLMNKKTTMQPSSGQPSKIMLATLGAISLPSKKQSEAAPLMDFLPPQRASALGNTSFSNSLSDVEAQLKALLTAALYLDEAIDPAKKFIDYGMDSITGVEFTKSVNAAFSLNLSATDLYDHPTIVELGSFIYAQLPLEEETKAAVVSSSSFATHPSSSYQGYLVKGIQEVSTTHWEGIPVAAPGPD